MNSAGNSILTNLGVTPVNANTSSSNLGSYLGFFFLLVILGVLSYLMYLYQNEIQQGWNDVKTTIQKYFETPSPPPQPSAPTEQPASPEESQVPDEKHGLPYNEKEERAAMNIEKILPGSKEVFNVSSNKFTYYDAAPMCKALGAELATYEQVKDAFSKGADWCNYGWVQGQMAVFPTQKETYEKLQLGPEEQRMTCGTVGVNGGYFDNPEMRFGVNCFGAKPPKSQHDAAELSKGAPISPDALAFDKKVNQYKSEADSIGLNPFNSSRW